MVEKILDFGEYLYDSVYGALYLSWYFMMYKSKWYFIVLVLDIVLLPLNVTLVTLAYIAPESVQRRLRNINNLILEAIEKEIDED
jgi:hypothetical protein